MQNQNKATPPTFQLGQIRVERRPNQKEADAASQQPARPLLLPTRAVGTSVDTSQVPSYTLR